MKPLHLVLTVAFLLQGTIASAESADLHDFNVGLAVGNCVAANCEIFRGYVLDDPTEGAEEITVKVTDWLLGAPLETDTIRVPHDVPSAGDGSGAAFVAWVNAKLSRNAPVTVVLATGQGWGVRAGHPVLVTSNDGEAATIRAVAEEAFRLQDHSELIPDSLASLSRAHNPALAGYLLGVIQSNPQLLASGTATNLLSQMMGNPGVPAEAWRGIPFWFHIACSGIVSCGPATEARRFAELVQDDDARAAKVGIEGLTSMANSNESPQTVLTPGVLDRVRTVYLRLLQGNEVSKSTALESALGLTPNKAK
jgi:hypothetical protein